eukprot:TRINITY_DN36440_c0_g1_i1.p1 TRINITY_DN36440_c0_g1~~TRINITY_DN36440_c0_g1_i1.p1  ORF type:complete len:506 (+),score=99.92 TRINITY_DN36440_c0_g1_i1:67-1518(+)
MDSNRRPSVEISVTFNGARKSIAQAPMEKVSISKHFTMWLFNKRHLFSGNRFFSGMYFIYVLLSIGIARIALAVYFFKEEFLIRESMDSNRRPSVEISVTFNGARKSIAQAPMEKVSISKHFTMWLFNKRHLFSGNRFFSGMYFIYVLLSIGIARIAFLVVESLGDPYKVKVWHSGCLGPGHLGFLVLIALIVAVNSGFTLIGRVVWKFKDSLKIWNDIIWTIVLLSFLCIYLIICAVKAKEFFAIHWFPYFSFFGVILPSLECLLIPSIGIPLWRVWVDTRRVNSKYVENVHSEEKKTEVTDTEERETRVAPETLPENVNDLTTHHVLKFKFLRNEFEQHLKSEFSSENYYLWRCLERWFASYADKLAEEKFSNSHDLETVELRQKALDSAKRIYKDFVLDGAPLMANLSFRTRDLLMNFYSGDFEKSGSDPEKFETLVCHFKDLQVEVINTMTDSFLRFRMTPQCERAFHNGCLQLKSVNA